MRVLVLDANAAAYGAHLRAAHPAFTIDEALDETAALRQAGKAEVIIALAQHVTPALIAAAPRLAFIQALTTGTDPIHALTNLPAGIVVASGRGIHGPQMAEIAFLLMLGLARGFPRMLANQRARVWERWPQKLLTGRTAVLLGVGLIAEAIAVRCRVFGMKVIGVSAGRGDAPGFDAVMPRTALAEAAALADFLIALVPYAPDTHHLIDAKVLGAMKPDAFLINIARGNVLDEAALAESLRGGRIAGAALDVFAQEPLPAGSPLWDLPGLIITPHVGGLSDIYVQQILPLLDHNLAAFAQGRTGDIRNRVALAQR